MHDILKKISLFGIVPVTKIDSTEDAVPLAKALCNGGLPCAEITFRTDAAEESIRRITRELPDMLVGAGTILTAEQADRAVAAGAKFIISPGLNPAVVKHCVDKGILITPGCSTPSDIERAIELDLDVVKFFPAEASGGIAAIKAMAAPYTRMKFIPTGGVSAKNLNDYLSFDKIIACGGSWMVDAKLINAGDFAAIERLTREAVQTMLGFRLEHVGINCENDKEAAAVANLFCKAFGFEYRDIGGAVFCGTDIEVMKKPYLGDKGHIAIGTNYLHRGKAYLESLGFTFNLDTYNNKVVYLNEQLGGFAVHLFQR
ncbi:MAG: bifunctional 4-hydroxy-2-oxoglutarate aldolase/2-dehydro-3-deoxy-phosphogluconate aldolase [Oscillospiraceae bacterium]|nr:bifunctional 4-hydroxy-2-oxoglutarate aldolase/2-dehydro-3-deoxy-phosphogluconate aldolase [Oscillospiraceae bacterium]